MDTDGHGSDKEEEIEDFDGRYIASGRILDEKARHWRMQRRKAAKRPDLFLLSVPICVHLWLKLCEANGLSTPPESKARSPTRGKARPRARLNSGIDSYRTLWKVVPSEPSTFFTREFAFRNPPPIIPLSRRAFLFLRPDQILSADSALHVREWESQQ